MKNLFLSCLLFLSFSLSAQPMPQQKNPLPIQVAFRHALFGRGIVLKIETIIKQDMPVTLTVHSAQLGTDTQFELNLSSRGLNKYGRNEGITLYPGDHLYFRNLQYQTLDVVVPQEISSAKPAISTT